MDISNYTETCQLHGSYRFTRPCNREFGWALVIMLHDLCALSAPLKSFLAHTGALQVRLLLLLF